jgi:hypothetical protein
MSSRGASFKKGFGRASLAAQIAAESANELARVFSGMAERYKRLAEQQDEGLVQWSVDSVEAHERPLKELRDQVRDLLVRARKAQSNVASQRF